MGDMSTYTAVFRLQPSDPQRRVTKRSRQPVSCAPCRARKLKCDRQQPCCGACARRGDADSCRFAPAAGSGGAAAVGGGGAGGLAAGGSSTNGGSAGPGPRHEVQARLQRLEEMINGLVNVPGRGGSTGPVSKMTPDSGGEGGSKTDGQQRKSSQPDQQRQQQQRQQLNTPDDEATPESTSSTGGHLRNQGPETSFVGATHWAAVLESIHDIQVYLEAEVDGPPVLVSHQDQATGAPDLLLGTDSMTGADVVKALPPRADCDRMLTFYFQAGYMRSPLIHIHQFRRAYEAFWERSEETSLLWASVLLSVLSMAAHLQDAKGVPCSSLVRSTRAADLSEAATRCLVAGEYLRARPYAVEALVLLCQSAAMQRRDSDRMLWSKWGVAVRLAQRMGYHRDPSHLRGRITPFEGEMRRRAWYMVETFDLLYSFQLGMPPIIHEDETDAAGPTNLRDEDFDEDSAALPPGRPLTEETAVQYYCYKSRTIRLLRKVIRHALSTRGEDYAETCRLNDELVALHGEVPPSLRVRPIRSASFTDTASDIMKRLMLELVYLKCLCVLHRRYLTPGAAAGDDGSDPRHARSREVCREAALRIMALHAEFDEETRLGGRLAEDQHLLTSLSLHDFLMAAMILSLDLTQGGVSDPADREKKIRILQDAYRSWSDRVCVSQDAAHATKVLGAMIRKVKDQEKLRKAAAPMETPSAEDAATIPTPAATVPALPVPETTQPQPQGYSQEWDFTLDDMDAMPLDSVMGEGNVDWNDIDAYLLNRQDGGMSMPTMPMPTVTEEAAAAAAAAAADNDPRSGWPYPDYDEIRRDEHQARSWGSSNMYGGSNGNVYF
ncbi:Zn 2cys6 transcription factor [Pleurostoma richardsiae]|uniref:Zn 2cys6 transcription factor n=1 Tax=Pleurostoma richardsiae TaxID=41990 RepID=A0AA38S4T2_9PEZI|nr:Zn 2cys6 transcription factor [Pleurostoma richardsiae]